MDGDAALEIALAVDHGVFLQELPLNADFLHPMNGGVGFIDQGFGQGLIHAALGHAFEIGEEIFPCVGCDVEGAVVFLI
jgi:hypothetical protein